MAAKKDKPTLNVGDLVRIPHYSNRRAKIVELRGPLAPGGKQVYGVIVRRKPTPVYIEVAEDQIVLLTAEAQTPHEQVLRVTPLHPPIYTSARPPRRQRRLIHPEFSVSGATFLATQSAADVTTNVKPRLRDDGR
jgi:hypothetical protein